VVANSSMGLWSGNLVNGVKYNEYGQLVPNGSAYVWTGTAFNGTYTTASCGSWNDNSLTAVATDRPTATDSGWIALETLACNQSARIYCISPPLSQTSSPGLGAPAETLLTREMLDPVLEQAISFWAGQGYVIPANDIKVGISDLPDTQLGFANKPYNYINFDEDAAGYGWSTSNVVPAERIDLLSVAVHEIGHVLGLGSCYGDVMDSFIEPGTRPASLDAWLQAQAPTEVTATIQPFEAAAILSPAQPTSALLRPTTPTVTVELLDPLTSDPLRPALERAPADTPTSTTPTTQTLDDLFADENEDLGLMDDELLEALL
jgi:hypothetical protein